MTKRVSIPPSTKVSTAVAPPSTAARKRHRARKQNLANESAKPPSPGPYIHVHTTRYDAVGASRRQDSSARDSTGVVTPLWLSRPAHRLPTPLRPSNTNAAVIDSSDDEGAMSPRSRTATVSRAQSEESRDPAAAYFGASKQHFLELDRLLRELLRQLTPKPAERDARIAVLRHICRVAHGTGLHIGVYGSTRTGVILPWSDLDLCAAESLDSVNEAPVNVAQPRRKGYSNPHFVAMLRALRRSNVVADVVPIAHARVPIIKCQERTTGTEVDISFTTEGIATSQYLVTELEKRENVLARPLIILVKLLLRKWNLHDPKDGGVGSFVTSLMVLWYVAVVDAGHWTMNKSHPHANAAPKPLNVQRQQHQRGRNGKNGAATATLAAEHLRNEQGRLSSLLVGFLRYWGEEFPFKTTGIDLRRRATFSKTLSSELHIVNPVVAGHNAASAATRFGTSVRQRLQAAARMLSAQPTKGKEASKATRAQAASVSPRSAVESLFGSEPSMWRRWDPAEYQTFKAAVARGQTSPAQQPPRDDDSGVWTSDDDDAAEVASPAPRPGNHQDDAVFLSVLIPSPVMGPTADPLPTKLKRNRRQAAHKAKAVGSRQSPTAAVGKASATLKPKRRRFYS